MRNTSAADRAWKSMTRSIPAQETADTHTSEAAERTAYATLLQPDGTRPAGGAGVTPWLLLRDVTARRVCGH